jgi:hypothetical protein
MNMEKLHWAQLARRKVAFRIDAVLNFLLVVMVVAAVAVPAVLYGYEAVKAKRQNARDLREERAPTGEVYWGTRIETKELFGEDRYMLVNGTELRVPHGSRFTIGSPLIDTKGARAAADGIVEIVVSPRQKMMDVSTWAGRAWLAPGQYTIMCDRGCLRMLVFVTKGVANIRGDASSMELALHDGESGAVKRGGRGEKIDSLTATRYYLEEWGMKP